MNRSRRFLWNRIKAVCPQDEYVSSEATQAPSALEGTLGSLVPQAKPFSYGLVSSDSESESESAAP